MVAKRSRRSANSNASPALVVEDVVEPEPSEAVEVEEVAATPEPVTEVPEAPAPPAAPVAASGYVVGPGMGITSLRGVLDCGSAVEASDFAGGQDTLDHLVSAERLVPR